METIFVDSDTLTDEEIGELCEMGEAGEITSDNDNLNDDVASDAGETDEASSEGDNSCESRGEADGEVK